MKTILYILAFLLVSALVYLGFYNAFYKPEFTVSTEGSERIVYLEVNGRYQLTDSVMKLVFNELYEKNGIVVTKGFAIHQPQPDDPEQKIKTLVAGCIVEAEDSTKLSLVSPKFTIGLLPEATYIVSDFPLKGKMSIMFGLYRVYPGFEKFCIENDYAGNTLVTEIYDRKAMRIHYRKKLMNVE